LERAGVALLPGTCFGEYGEGYVRLCYTRQPEIIEEACERMKNALIGGTVQIASIESTEQVVEEVQPVMK